MRFTEPPDPFTERVDREQDDLLSTLQLVAGNADLERRILGRLVDRLLDGLILDLRDRYVAGELDRLEYQQAILDLTDQARSVGLESVGPTAG